MKKLILLIALALPALLTAQQRDWANYGRYAEANAQLTTPPAVVFMGNSITDGWDNAHPEFFTANNFACRGIGGQVTGQMLCRFRADVINLHPQAVVILAGTNDLAQNNGPIATQHIVENIISMAELAMAAGIRPIICSVLPAGKYPWRTEITYHFKKQGGENKWQTKIKKEIIETIIIMMMISIQSSENKEKKFVHYAMTKTLN